MLVAVVSFIFGALVSALIMHIIFSKNNSSAKEELIRLRAKVETSENLQEIIKRDFVQLANETIKNEQEDLRRQNRETLEEKILPLTKELGEFKEKVEHFNLKGVENTTKIVEQITNLEKNNKVIEQEAKNLVEALTKNQNVKGAYGEELLDTILQQNGMQEGVHYSKQFVTTSTNLKDEEIHTIRPDVIVNLPNERHLIIDSKVTLTSYLECIEDESKIGEFKTEVKKRIVDLANKNYQNAEGISQPDFVLMYMPIESSISLLYEDSDIIKQAYKSNIIIVGTASLLTTIRLVNHLFAQQKQAESVQQIVTAGTNLYETFVQFCEDLIDVQKRMADVNSRLNTTINRFNRNSKNKPSLFSQVNALKDFGINTNKEIPQSLLLSEEETLLIEEKQDELEGVLAND
ncbi:MAG: DNA recombination protein RmuC [Cyanobacteria bacterium SIG31]|nr:DNA recombination protein RmuC [Cyanobacteria bacterium SIG31]